MGWASGGDIFDVVARELIDYGAVCEIKEIVLGTLIDALQDCDWDTEGESLEEFQDDPVIVELFADRGISFDEEES